MVGCLCVKNDTSRPPTGPPNKMVFGTSFNIFIILRVSWRELGGHLFLCIFLVVFSGIPGSGIWSWPPFLLCQTHITYLGADTDFLLFLVFLNPLRALAASAVATHFWHHFGSIFWVRVKRGKTVQWPQMDSRAKAYILIHGFWRICRHVPISVDRCADMSIYRYSDLSISV